MRLFPPERVASFLELGWWSGDTLDSRFEQHLARRPDEVAIVDAPNRSTFTQGDPRRLTWADLRRSADGVATEFLKAGLGEGDVIGIQLPNIVELAVVYLAGMRIGAIVSPFPAQYREHEVLSLASIGGFRALVTASRVGGRDNAAELAALAPRIPSLQHCFAFGTGLPDGVIPLDPALEGAADPSILADYRANRVVDANDCLTLCWTSGTESNPKGVPRAHGDWLAVVQTTAGVPEMNPDSVLLCTFPMVNAGGMGGMFVPWMREGCRLVLHHPFDLDTFLAQISAESVTHSVSPPAILTQLLQEPERLANTDLSSLRTMGSGSTTLLPSMIEGWEALGIEIINFFGSNEGLSLAGCRANIPEPELRGSLLPRPGSHGLPTNVESDRFAGERLVDLATGEDIHTAGRPGELRLVGPTIFAGYWGGDGSEFDEQGYFRTGDVFEYVGDQLQYVSFLGRSKELIVRGGFKISPADIEGLVEAHPKVAEVAAVGWPDPRLGERVCVFVVPQSGQTLTLNEIVDFLKERKVATFKLPERLEIVDSLPRNAIGKVLKRDLKASLQPA
ncbi:Acyl-CoA synthetase (AMP-forming)/AMP-acid ligase II [Frankineae bacterium MT45]|nr:Acyl-CoA synthetase (AMP-forming)/AMP-acid ligase II [Frankineae bacterium MT45]